MGQIKNECLLHKYPLIDIIKCLHFLIGPILEARAEFEQCASETYWPLVSNQVSKSEVWWVT